MCYVLRLLLQICWYLFLFLYLYFIYLFIFVLFHSCIKTRNENLKSDTTKRTFNNNSHHAKDVLIDIAQDVLPGQNI